MTFRERRLLSAFRAGDQGAFDSVYREYAPRVFAFACRITSSPTEAEDLTQEVFLAAFRGHANFQGNSSLLTWLLAVTSRKWRDQQRAYRPSITTIQEEDSRVSAAPENHLLRLSISEAIEALDPSLREAFILVAVEGLKHREAAEVTDSPVGTVKWRVAEATRRLRRALEQGEESESRHVQAIR